jgi:hypothetical protein
MANSKNAKIQIETNQSLNAHAAMTDSGDHRIFTLSGKTLWSGKAGYTPEIRPNGVVSGRSLLSAHASANMVTVAAFTAYLKGVLISSTATDMTIGRASTAAYIKISSLSLSSAAAVAVVAGTQGAAESATRGAAGGPPLIPPTSIEIGQIVFTGTTAAVVAVSEILQNGSYTERALEPMWTEKNVGDGEACATSAEKNAHIKFASALPLIHTGAIAKKVYAKVYTPALSELSRTMNFRPSENSHSVSSQEYYRGTVGSTATSIGQGGFTALMSDNLTDSLVGEKDQVLTVKFYPDENKAAHAITQGKIGLTRTFPFDNQNQAEVTISAENATAEFAS